MKPARSAGPEVITWKGMYVDLHCHLLPGLDDGAAGIEDTIAHARRLEAAGVHDVACTPHIKRRDFPRVHLPSLAELRAEVQRELDAEGIGVRLHGGGELAHEDALWLGHDDLERIAQGPAGARWLLLETPFEGVRQDFVDAASRLWELGYGVLIAHPERSPALPGAEARIRRLIACGALVQVNSTSLLGHHGAAAQASAERLVRQGVVFCLASDGHPGTRETTLDRGHEALERLGLGGRELTQDNPRTLLRDGVAGVPLAA